MVTKSKNDESMRTEKEHRDKSRLKVKLVGERKNRLRESGPHIYTTSDGKRVPSVTTIISRFKDATGLLFWANKLGMQGIEYTRALKMAADIGTIMHDLVEDFFHSQKVHNERDIQTMYQCKKELAIKARRSFGAFQDWIAGVKLEVIRTELELSSDSHKFGGRMDLIGKVGGKISVVDWKSANGVYQDYLIQLAAYGMLWDEKEKELHRIAKKSGKPKALVPRLVEQYVLLRFDKETGDFHHHSWQELEEAKKQFLLFREAYDIDKALRQRCK